MNFLRDILTIKELEEFANRLEMAKLLKAGMSYKAIAKKLKVSLIFTLTFRSNLFCRLGFEKTTFGSLPRIIFTEKTVDLDKAYGLNIS